MSPQLRRAADQAAVDSHDKFLRASAWIAISLGAVQVVVRVVGDVFLWILQVRAVHNGKPPPAYPDMPWGYWSSIVGFVVLSLIGAAFWKNQIGQPGRVLDLVLGMLPRRGAGEKVTAEARVTVEADDESEEQ